MGVQLRDRNRRRVGGKGCLRERIDLRSVEVIAEKGIFVGRQVDSVRVSAQVRVVTDAGVCVRRRKRRRYDAKRWNSSASVVWGAEVAIVLNLYAIYGPCRGGRIATVADREVKVVLTGEIAGRREHLEGEHIREPAIGGGVVIAARIGHLGTDDEVGAIKLRRVAEESVEILHASSRAVRTPDRHDVVDDFHLESVAHA